MKYVDIVFDWPPGNESGRFVEVDDDKGKSIRFGEWVKRTDGYWALRISRDGLGITEGVLRIAEERERQIREEGWTFKHDDNHADRSLARAAMAYCESSIHKGESSIYAKAMWPIEWAKRGFKPSTSLRDLEKAGALIAAEIDRRLRKGEK